MKFFLTQCFAAALLFIATINAESIQIAPSQGIYVPGAIAQNLRFSRSAYGGSAPAPAPSYSAPAPAQSYSAPAPAQSYSAPAPAPSYSAPAPAQSYSAPAPAQSYSAPAAAPQTIPAPPCPKNYLFSCQPSLTPAPCSPSHGGSSSYGSSSSYSAAVGAAAPPSLQAAYSHYIPQYAAGPFVRELY